VEVALEMIESVLVSVGLAKLANVLVSVVSVLLEESLSVNVELLLVSVPVKVELLLVSVPVLLVELVSDNVELLLVSVPVLLVESLPDNVELPLVSPVRVELEDPVLSLEPQSQPLSTVEFALVRHVSQASVVVVEFPSAVVGGMEVEPDKSGLAVEDVHEQVLTSGVDPYGHVPSDPNGTTGVVGLPYSPEVTPSGCALTIPDNSGFTGAFVQYNVDGTTPRTEVDFLGSLRYSIA